MGNRTKIWLSVCIALLFVVSVLLVPHAGLASATSRPNKMSGATALRASTLMQIQGTTSLNTSGNVTVGGYTIVPAPAIYNPNHVMVVTVVLKPINSLQNYLNTVDNPNSPLYNHFLTAGAVANNFGVSLAVYSKIASYFESYGLTVLPNQERLSISLQGTASEMSAAFHTKIMSYYEQYKSGGLWNPLFGNDSSVNGSVTEIPFYSNNQIASLPAPIASYVSGISGLNGVALSPSIAMPYGFNPFTNTSVNSAPDSTTTVSSSQALYYANGNYTWANNSITQSVASGDYQFLYPGTMHMLTGANNLWDGHNTIASEPDLGQGVTIAVIEVGTIDPLILQQFGQEVFHNPNQVTARLTQIPLLGANVYSGYNYGWTFETALDIEYIATMAPQAHIDLVAVPNPDLGAFDYAYAYISAYLTTGNNASTSVTITSNSYGTGELYTAFFGSPVYLTVENTLLSALAVQGVTNFFASGDFGGTYLGQPPLQASVPAMATGVTSVGGGMVTAESNGQEFPDTGVMTSVGGMPMTVAPATGVSHFTYWAYGYNLVVFGQTIPLFLPGYEGGGFGQSITLQQPWWQNALDTYSSGARIEPVVSGAAAFNMTVYAGSLYAPFGFNYNFGWQLFYGGTSFATPITAGEWALIEEQALVAFGSAKFGDINPALFALHNAYQAGISSSSANPYLAMQDIGTGPAPQVLPYQVYIQTAAMWSNTNSMAYNLLNQSKEFPGDQNLPYWFATLFNPAGDGWNYLQGLGMIRATTLANELIGQVPGVQHGLMNEPFSVLQVTPGGLQPITSLQAGTAYTLQVVLANGQSGGYYNVVAYSDNPNNGTYGGGVTTTLQTAGNGQFTYTPVWNNATPAPSGSSYGYFKIVSAASSDWAFQPFAVVQPNLTAGNLSLGVFTPGGLVTSGEAQVTMFVSGGIYSPTRLAGKALVTLNGMPVSGATVDQWAVNVTFSDPYLPSSVSSDGSFLGQFLSDRAGTAAFWTNAALEGLSGVIRAQVFVLQASYRGLATNPITVVVEPELGHFANDFALNSAGTALVGTLQFMALDYVNWLNISIGSAPGQYVNTTFANGTTTDGSIPVNLSPLPPPGTAVVVTVTAEGYNVIPQIWQNIWSTDLIFGVFLNFPVANTLYWQDPIVIANPGPAPAASLASSASPTVNGNVTLLYAGSWEASGATGTLTVSYGNTVSTLLTTGTLTGSYVWNSANYPDGFYTLAYTVTTPTGLHSTSSVVLYVDNTASQLDAQIVKLQDELATAQSTIRTLQGELASDNATIALMQTQINSLNAQVSRLTSQLSAEMAKYNATAASLAAARSQLNADNSTTIAMQKATIAALQSSLNTDNATIASQSAQISSLKAQIAALQSELRAKNNFAPSALYDVFGGLGVLLIGVLAVVALLIGVVIGRHRRTAKSSGSPSMTNLFATATVPQVQAAAERKTHHRRLRE